MVSLVVYMAWVGKQVKNARTGVLGVITSEEHMQKSHDLWVDWDDGSSDHVQMAYNAYDNDIFPKSRYEHILFYMEGYGWNSLA